jgi:hypothetical protein
MADEFEWGEEDTVIRSVSAVAVYVGQHRDLVIRQESPLGQEDQIIVVPLDRARALLLAIQNIIDEHKPA